MARALGVGVDSPSLVALGVPLERAAAFAVVHHLGQLAPIAVLGIGAVATLAARRAPHQARNK